MVDSKLYRCAGCGHVRRHVVGCPRWVRAARSFPDRVQRCSRCGGTGHNVRTCAQPKPKAATKVLQGILVCFRCRRPGHSSDECPDRPAAVKPETLVVCREHVRPSDRANGLARVPMGAVCHRCRRTAVVPVVIAPPR